MTQEQKETLRFLADKYELTEDHFFISKHFVIVNKIGIEKIAKKENIKFIIEVIEANSTYSAVKVGVDGSIWCTQYASASQTNSNNNYYLEMAIKRAKAKCVLDLVGAYDKGIYSEQEADEFTQDQKK
tara:strand:- start:1164 stop:1547 length:384 start_codon:yes stop_codon:yes gene_type:complete